MTNKENSRPGAQPFRPVLVFDGDCGFCSYWVRYWQRLTGDGVRYLPYQEVLEHYPEIPEQEFQRAIQMFLPGGRHCSGAEAAFRVLARVPGRGIWLWLYRHLPGFPWLAEAAYDVVARHRIGAGRVARLLWGAERVPPTYQSVIWVFLRLLGLIYLAAFASFAVQAQGLIGSEGILPYADFLALARQHLGVDAYWRLPGVFWLADGDTALNVVCLTGVVASVLLVLNRLTPVMLPVLFALYLSLFYAGQTFTNFQWDIFLLEAGFLAIFLPYGSRIVVWLYRWLLFRFMLLSGAVKLLSGDPAWAGLDALKYHFQTQPLPTPLAWYIHHWPDGVLRFGVGATFFIELVIPFLVFLPRRLRQVAAWSFLALQLAIVLTGNYNFFNLLTIFLLLFLFDDQALHRILPDTIIRRAGAAVRAPKAVATGIATLLGLLLVTTSASMLWARLAQQSVPPALAPLVSTVNNWQLVNNYGLFAVMTVRRPEIVVEGSLDGVEWTAYEFRYKPGKLDRSPGLNIPHQPRLDWQMWFAALDDPRRVTWFPRFLQRLLEGAPDVLGLLEDDPFAGRLPRYVRARIYEYRFTTPQERGESGNWWARKLLGIYYPPLQQHPTAG